MIYPLVRELAAEGVPVTVTCRVLEIARQPYYRWLTCPVTDAELDEAWLTNAIFDSHSDDPEFGYRLIADEVRHAGHEVCDRTVWRICRDNGWWSCFGKPRASKSGTARTPAHDHLVRRQFHADAKVIEDPDIGSQRDVGQPVAVGTTCRCSNVVGDVGFRHPGVDQEAVHRHASNVLSPR